MEGTGFLSWLGAGALSALFLMHPLALAQSELDPPRRVTGTPAFDHMDGIRFPTASAACQYHIRYLKDRTGTDYQMRGAEEGTGPGVRCSWGNKEGQWDQVVVTRVLVCPAEFSAFDDKMCECTGDSCKGPTPALPSSTADCDHLKKLDGPELISQLIEIVRGHMNTAHQKMVNNPSEAMGRGILSERQIAALFGKKSGGKGSRSDGKEVLSDRAFAPLYGIALERLTAALVEKDHCAAQFVVYQTGRDQMKEGVNPDFIGKGKAEGLKIDITTAGEASRKSSSEARAEYKYLTYSRRLVIDSCGHAVPSPTTESSGRTMSGC